MAAEELPAERARDDGPRAHQVHDVHRLFARGIDAEIASSVLFFLSLFFLTFIIATTTLTALGLDFITAFSGALSCISNVGPAIGNIIGPEQTYASLPNTAKWILSGCMLAGRLEFTSIVVLFLPFLLRKNT